MLYAADREKSTLVSCHVQGCAYRRRDLGMHHCTSSYCRIVATGMFHHGDACRTFAEHRAGRNHTVAHIAIRSDPTRATFSAANAVAPSPHASFSPYQLVCAFPEIDGRGTPARCACEIDKSDPRSAVPLDLTSQMRSQLELVLPRLDLVRLASSLRRSAGTGERCSLLATE